MRTTFTRKWLAVALVALVSALAIPASAAAAKPIRIFEETAEAFWEVPFACADGSTAPGTLLVKPTSFFEAPQIEDPDPTARLQFLAVCPGGISFSWGAPTVPAVITSTSKLRRLTASGSGVARDILGVSHPVTFNVEWRQAGPLEKIRNAPGSETKTRVATATGQVTFDGALIAGGPSNHPTRPAPFIRVDIER